LSSANLEDDLTTHDGNDRLQAVECLIRHREVVAVQYDQVGVHAAVADGNRLGECELRVHGQHLPVDQREIRIGREPRWRDGALGRWRRLGEDGRGDGCGMAKASRRRIMPRRIGASIMRVKRPRAGGARDCP
jgi:hypothetical protein